MPQATSSMRGRGGSSPPGGERERVVREAGRDREGRERRISEEVGRELSRVREEGSRESRVREEGSRESRGREDGSREGRGREEGRERSSVRKPEDSQDLRSVSPCLGPQCYHQYHRCRNAICN